MFVIYKVAATHPQQADQVKVGPVNKPCRPMWNIEEFVNCKHVCYCKFRDRQLKFLTAPVTPYKLSIGPATIIIICARCVTNRRAIAMMFVRLSVCLCGTGVHCDHTVQFSADWRLLVDSPVFWAPWHQSMSTYSQPSFSISTWNKGGVWMRKLREALLTQILINK